jgi:hypothetical protein
MRRRTVFSPALRFLQTAYRPGDWVAVFLKAYDTGRVEQEVGSVEMFCCSGWQTWMSVMNTHRFNVYVSVNALHPGATQRTREAIASVRHVFLEADHDGAAVVAAIRQRVDLPSPSYVLQSSPDRVHVFWRVEGFSCERVESMQKRLARELGTDTVATPCSQTTRLPGFANWKREPPSVVSIAYHDVRSVFVPSDFPAPAPATSVAAPEPAAAIRLALIQERPGPLERARRYLAAIPPAVAGKHGDVHTFRVCCRLVRGFALYDEDALELLGVWNERCVPPWSEGELRDKLRRARRYGRETIGGLLEEAP